jgi:hypothetical protein
MILDAMEIQEIIEHLPHRYPMLLIDRVLSVDPGKEIIALKNVTINEPFFRRAFPALSGHAGRADRRGDGAGCRRAGLQDLQSEERQQERVLLRRHR